MQEKEMVLDEIDRRIVDLLREKPELTQLQISKELSVSQSTVATRLNRMKKEGLLQVSIGLNIKKLGLILARCDIRARDIGTVLAFAKKCPLFVDALSTTGIENLNLFFIAENPETFESIVNDHIRKIPDVTQVDLSLMFPTFKPIFLSIETVIDRTAGPPCGVTPFCNGCPGSTDYTGKVWAKKYRSRAPD